MERQRCLAVCIETDHEYWLDLTRFGVRKEWSSEAIWDVARREMRLSWNKPVTSWGWEPEPNPQCKK